MTRRQGSLLSRAKELIEKSREYRAWEDRRSELEGLATRKDETARIRTRSSQLSRSARLLRQKAAVPQATLRTEQLGEVVRKTEALLAGFEKDPITITKPRALDNLKIEETLNELQERCEQAWTAFAVAGEKSGVEAILEKFPEFRVAAAQVRQIRSKLQNIAASLPERADDIVEVEKLKAELKAKMRELGGESLDLDVRNFLARSVDGVTLADLLSRPKVLEWIKEYRLERRFKVRQS